MDYQLNLVISRWPDLHSWDVANDPDVIIVGGDGVDSLRILGAGNEIVVAELIAENGGAIGIEIFDLGIDLPNEAVTDNALTLRVCISKPNTSLAPSKARRCWRVVSGLTGFWPGNSQPPGSITPRSRPASHQARSRSRRCSDSMA